MRTVKTTFLAILLVMASQVVWSQTHDSAAGPTTDPLKTVKLYPNPATDYLVIRFETPIAHTVSIQLHSIIGNQLEADAEVVDEFEIHLRVKDLPTGYYLLALKDGGQQRNSFKFLKR